MIKEKKSSSFEIDISKIRILFFIFTLSTTALLIRSYLPSINEGALYIFKQILIYFGFFGNAVVILLLVFYYISRASKWLRENKTRLIITAFSVLGIGYAISSGIHENSWMVFLRDLFFVGLIICGLPYVEKLLGKIGWKKKKNSKKRK